MSTTKSNIPRPSAETLRSLYVDQILGCPDIARLFERDAKTVFWWLRQAKIPTRPRGSNPATHFKPGQRSDFCGRRHRPESIAKGRALTIADGRVPYLRDGQHWLASAPPEQNPNWKGGLSPERQEFYRSPEWKAAVKEVWHRADAHCQRCGLDWRDCDHETTPTFHVHHVMSFQVRETRCQQALMVLLCRPCHLFVHSYANVTGEFLPQAPDAPLFRSRFDPAWANVIDWESAVPPYVDPSLDSRTFLESAREMSMPSLFDFDASQAEAA